MNIRIYFYTLSFFLGLLFVVSCSTSPKNTDLLEYGYKGAVKSVKSTTYFDLIQENDEWVLDKTKIGNIKVLTFNEDGNITKVVTTYPQYPDDIETTIFEFEDGRKSGFHKILADNDTIETGVYKWINETEYNLISVLYSGRRIVSNSKLNANFRDLSGGYTYTEGDSIIYANSYVNTINDKNLITRIHFTNEVTKEKNIFSMNYSEFDSNGNPLRLEMVDEKTGILDNLSIRKFYYK